MSVTLNPVNPPRVRAKILIIDLSPITAVLQSCVSIAAVKQMYPEHEIHGLIAHEGLDLVQRSSVFASVRTPPVDSSQLQDFVNEVLDLNVDFIFNWTREGDALRLSRLLTQMIPSAIKFGAVESAQGAHHALDGWSMILESWEPQGVHYGIHPIDVLTTQVLTALQIHCGDPTGGVHSPISHRNFFGATDVNFVLSPQRVGISRRILDQGLNPFHAGREFTVVEWAQIIRACDVWVAFDEFTACLSAILGVRTLRVFSDSADLMDLRKAPYGNDHCGVLDQGQPDEIWAETAEDLLRGKALGRGYYTRIRAPQEGGGVALMSDLPVPTSFLEWIAKVRAQVLRSWFCGWMPPIEVIARDFVLNPDLIREIRKHKESNEVFARLAQEGRGYATRLRDLAKSFEGRPVMSLEERGQVDALGQDLVQVETLLSRVTQVTPAFAPLLRFYQVSMRDLRANTIEGMAAETESVFALLIEATDVIQLYCDHTLDRAKPRPTKTAPERFT